MTQTVPAPGRVERVRDALLRPRAVDPSAGPLHRALFVPLVVVLAWWVLSLVIYLVGYPIPYLRINAGLVAALVLACTAAVGLAYWFVNRRAVPQILPVTSRRLPWPLLIGTIASLVLIIPWAETYSGYHVWQIVPALLNQPEAYAAAAKRVTEGTGSRLLVVAAQTVLAPLTLAVLPYGALSWFERRRHLWVLIAGLLVQLWQTILVARDYYLTLAIALCVFAWLLSRIRRRMPPTRWFWIISVLGFAAFLIVFVLRKLGRPTGPALCPPGATQCAVLHPPTLWESIGVYFATYSSQSMEGLGRALEGVWAFGGGFRHSPALTELILRALHLPRTVVITDQLDGHGWSDTGYWSTGFAWMANDVPWVLVPVVVLGMAAFWALSARRAVRSADWLSVTLFCWGSLTMFFLVQNNQITISGPTYIGYLALSVLFLAREVRDLVRRRRGRAAQDPEEVPADDHRDAPRTTAS